LLLMEHRLLNKLPYRLQLTFSKLRKAFECSGFCYEYFFYVLKQQNETSNAWVALSVIIHSDQYRIHKRPARLTFQL
jgi:hypothetical protein